MRIFIIWIVLTTIMCFSLLSGQTTTKKEFPGFESEVKIKTISVNVTDKSGNAIAGLQKKNFKIFQENKAQDFEIFKDENAELSVVLMIEFSKETSFLLEDIREAAFTIIQSAKPQDYCAIVTFGNAPVIEQDFTTDKNKLLNTVAMLRWKVMTGIELFTSIDYVLDRMKDLKGKKGIVLLSTGLKSAGGDLDALLEKVRRSNVPIYAISMGKRQFNAMSGSLSDSANSALFQADFRLRKIAGESNGGAYFPNSPGAFKGIAGNIMQILSNQYLIAIYTNDVKKRIKIEVAADINRDGKDEKLKVNYPE